jgi:hypothetical protein
VGLLALSSGCGVSRSDWRLASERDRQEALAKSVPVSEAPLYSRLAVGVMLFLPGPTWLEFAEKQPDGTYRILDRPQKK